MIVAKNGTWLPSPLELNIGRQLLVGIYCERGSVFLSSRPELGEKRCCLFYVSASKESNFYDSPQKLKTKNVPYFRTHFCTTPFFTVSILNLSRDFIGYLPIPVKETEEVWHYLKILDRKDTESN